MRLRVLELPSEVSGDTVTSRFAYVLDDVGDVPAREHLDDWWERLRGGPAADALVFRDRIELGE